MEFTTDRKTCKMANKLYLKLNILFFFLVNKKIPRFIFYSYFPTNSAHDKIFNFINNIFHIIFSYTRPNTDPESVVHYIFSIWKHIKILI